MERMVGTVLWFNDAKGFGFLLTPSHERLFVHHSQIPGTPGQKTLLEGEKVSFELGLHSGKACAVNVQRNSGGV